MKPELELTQDKTDWAAVGSHRNQIVGYRYVGTTCLDSHGRDNFVSAKSSRIEPLPPLIHTFDSQQAGV
jgi:hypothetical protein